MTKPKIGKPPGIKKKVQFEERHIPETEDSKPIEVEHFEGKKVPPHYSEYCFCIACEETRFFERFPNKRPELELTKLTESIPVEMICLGCGSIQNASLTCSQSETIAAGVMTGFCKKCQDEKKHLWEEPIAKHTFISRFWKYLTNFGRK